MIFHGGTNVNEGVVCTDQLGCALTGELTCEHGSNKDTKRPHGFIC